MIIIDETSRILARASIHIAGFQCTGNHSWPSAVTHGQEKASFHRYSVILYHVGLLTLFSLCRNLFLVDVLYRRCNRCYSTPQFTGCVGATGIDPASRRECMPDSHFSTHLLIEGPPISHYFGHFFGHGEQRNHSTDTSFAAHQANILAPGRGVCSHPTFRFLIILLCNFFF